MLYIIYYVLCIIYCILYYYYYILLPRKKGVAASARNTDGETQVGQLSKWKAFLHRFSLSLQLHVSFVRPWHHLPVSPLYLHHLVAICTERGSRRCDGSRCSTKVGPRLAALACRPSACLCVCVCRFIVSCCLRVFCWTGCPCLSDSWPVDSLCI